MYTSGTKANDGDDDIDLIAFQRALQQPSQSRGGGAAGHPTAPIALGYPTASTSSGGGGGGLRSQTQPGQALLLRPTASGRSVTFSSTNNPSMSRKKESTFALNKLVNLNYWPFFGKDQAFLGRTVWDFVTGQPKITFSDIIDRLNSSTVPKFLLFFVAFITANIFGIAGGEPMACLKTPELNQEEREYAIDYCTTKNTYYVPPDEGIPWSDVERQKRQLGYYHWVPITLLIQAMLFCLPNWLWKTLNGQSGIDYEIFIREAVELRPLALTDPERERRLLFLSAVINEALGEGRIPRRIHGFRFGASVGFYIASLYVFIKALYLFNVVGQFFLLNLFIGRRYSLWGLEVLQTLLTGENWQDSPIFPRLTLCDVPIRRLGDTPRYTLQCHLRINTYNEKIYLFIWWGLLVVAILTLVNFLYYLVYLLLLPWTRERAARHLLKQQDFLHIVYSGSRRNIHVVRCFAEYVLRHDGVLLFWFIEGHAGPIIARAVAGRIFGDYLQRLEEREGEMTPEQTSRRGSSAQSQQNDDDPPWADDEAVEEGESIDVKKIPPVFAVDSSANTSPSKKGATRSQQRQQPRPPTAPFATGEESPFLGGGREEEGITHQSASTSERREGSRPLLKGKPSMLSRLFGRVIHSLDLAEQGGNGGSKALRGGRALDYTKTV